MAGENVIAWIVVGLLGGWLARVVARGQTPGALGLDLLAGVVGGLLGGWIFSWFGHLGLRGINLASVIVAFIAAFVLLLLLRVFSGKKVA